MGLFRRNKTTTSPAIPLDPCQGDPHARMLYDSLARRDWGPVRDFLAGVTDPDLHAFYVDICADVDGVQEWIGDVARAEPDSTLPLLIRGAHGVHWAWQARGAAQAQYTSEQQFAEFFRRLKFAENCLDEVAERDHDDTTARTFLVVSARGRQVPKDEAHRRFEDVVKRHPGHLMAHKQMLQFLCRKWYGSHEEMFAFARDAVANAPNGSPLGVLIPDAHIERWLDLDTGDNDYFQQAEVQAEVRAAADRTVRHPDFVDRAHSAYTYNAFACVFCLGDDDRSAAELFDRIGDRVTKYPWAYGAQDPGAWFQKLRGLSYRAVGR